MKYVFVAGEYDGGDVHHVTLELLSCAASLYGEDAYRILCVLPDGFCDVAEQVGRAGADEVVYTGTANRTADLRWTAAVTAELVHRYNPETVLFGATSRGRIIAPMTAAILGAGITADCTDLRRDETGRLLQIRPALGGNILATITTRGTPQIASVRPRVFTVDTVNDCAAAVVDCPIEVRADTPMVNSFLLPKAEKEDSAVDIADASRIVAVGRGIGSRDHLDLVHAFASCIDASVACSRGIVELGWMDVSRQVGQSGRTVSPELYIALGISGAVQHLAGMDRADTVVAVNIDSDAPICSHADLVVRSDAMLFLRNCLERCRFEDRG